MSEPHCRTHMHMHTRPSRFSSCTVNLYLGQCALWTSLTLTYRSS